MVWYPIRRRAVSPCVPGWWWPVLYPGITVIYVVLLVVLLAKGYSLVVAAGVPALINTMVIGTLATLARLAGAPAPGA